MGLRTIEKGIILKNVEVLQLVVTLVNYDL